MYDIGKSDRQSIIIIQPIDYSPITPVMKIICTYVKTIKV